MKQIYRRIIAFIMCIVFSVSTVLTAFADLPGGSGSSVIPAITPGGKGYLNNPAPIFRDYGFRVTITDSSQLQGTI